MTTLANPAITATGRSDHATTADPRVGVVIITRDRREGLLDALSHLVTLPEQPRIVVVDNGSTDGTPAAVRAAYPSVAVLDLPENEGAAARNHGVRLLDTPYVAFADDDSWWAPGALTRAADLLDAYPSVAVLNARILLRDEQTLEPACAEMAASPLPTPPDLPGPRLLGFIACGAVVRRDAYLAEGGFHRAFGVGGEEELLALDLAAAGWDLVYADDVIAHHHPSPSRNPDRRRAIVTRNALWAAWLRRPLPAALSHTATVLRAARTDPHVRSGLTEALRGLPWVLRERTTVPAAVERDIRTLEQPAPTDTPQQASVPVWSGPDTPDAALPTVSVVMPTFRRDDLLRRCLLALLDQDYPQARLEIIVVDDAAGDTVPTLVAEIAAAHPDVPITALTGVRRGPATARNIGLRAATGEIIAFIDDDAYPEDRHWLCAGVAPFQEADINAVSGKVTVPIDGRPTDFQRNVQALEQGVFLTCNAFYRRSTLDAIGGFDEVFTVPFREDTDLQWRVEALGGRSVRQPRARVIHPAPPGRFAVSLKLQRNSQFNARLYKKDPARFRAEVQARPPYHYYATLAAGGGALITALSGHRRAARPLALLWLALNLRFLRRRLRGTSRSPRHLLDMTLTSFAIPPLSIYWRIRGAIRERVLYW